MARTAVPLTGTQMDDKLFNEFVSEITRIGGLKLASYGKVSRETIYQYCRRRPVSEKTEDLIRDSIKDYRKELLTAQLSSQDKTKKVLAV